MSCKLNGVQTAHVNKDMTEYLKSIVIVNQSFEDSVGIVIHLHIININGTNRAYMKTEKTKHFRDSIDSLRQLLL